MGVLFVAVVELTDVPSIVRLHNAVVKRLSVSLKLKLIAIAEVLRPLAGELRATAGGVVSTVKVLVALVPVLLAESVQDTFQLWVPWLRPE